MRLNKQGKKRGINMERSTAVTKQKKSTSWEILSPRGRYSKQRLNYITNPYDSSTEPGGGGNRNKFHVQII